jgi:hypothetical protein
MKLNHMKLNSIKLNLKKNIYKNKFYLFFFFILIILFFSFIYFKNIKNVKETFNNIKEKPKIWCYWETMKGKKKPAYIDLCYDSLLHNCTNCFDIILLNERNIETYLPNVNTHIPSLSPFSREGRERRKAGEIDLSSLSIPHKTDYYRYALLEKYGGIWIDADIIVTRCLCPLYKQLLHSNKDYMGFGCGRSRKSCSLNPNGKYNPTNWLMMSKPKSKFMKCVNDNAQNIIQEKGNDFSYHEIGKVGLQKCIEVMQNKDNDWDYIHIPSTCQEYDDEGNKLNNIMRPYDIKKCTKKRYFFPLYNTAPGYPEWFKNLSKDDLWNERTPTDEKYYLKDILTEAFSKKEKC